MFLAVIYAHTTDPSHLLVQWSTRELRITSIGNAKLALTWSETSKCWLNKNYTIINIVCKSAVKCECSKEDKIEADYATNLKIVSPVLYRNIAPKNMCDAGGDV